MLWAETSKVITLSPDVWSPHLTWMTSSANPPAVVSGASATIVSDALMNPFDGKSPHTFHEGTALTVYSC